MARKTKKRNWLTTLAFACMGIVCVYIVVIYWIQKTAEDKAKFTFYPGFEIEIPEGYSIHGIDVSNYQKTIYWPSVKKMQENKIGLRFVFIKATEGLGNTDKQFSRNWQNAANAKVVRGAYHFFLATKDGKLQANNFIKRVSLAEGDLPPVLDIEQLYGVPPEVMRARVKDWLNTIEDHYNVKPIIYSSASFYNSFLGPGFNEYPLWVAHYFEKKQPRINRPWQFWQYSYSGHVNGITTPVDFNVYNGDSTTFKQLLVP